MGRGQLVVSSEAAFRHRITKTLALLNTEVLPTNEGRGSVREVRKPIWCHLYVSLNDKHAYGKSIELPKRFEVNMYGYSGVA